MDDELIAEVGDEIGIEAYRIYPNSRRLIPEPVLWGIASACVIEFVKGLVDFKGLGEATKSRLLELSRRFRERDSLESFVEHNDLTEPIRLALSALPKKITDEDYEKGRGELEAALRLFGLPSASAQAHAAAIAEHIRKRSTC